ncbi:hypothetical protein DCAR_0623592 [Daucus carota subsp. sativus]|uniref:NB-ARC domain-containing protein n=1 Tax=Daucus carota subsp. sativus TaxID=79200 RepID=A0A161ZR03_DAUCS|nr:PREDICTED: disease resistance protein RPP13-like [Daucus carota subsp. sativus]XP_017255941.1 PREDICTED: disease resistance protein RPP13-like [Daucus carota subsp. sativus]WOH04183.1 hypothetical protein DCAR_0623592 [Daucus carota subsp. sativus]
MADQMVSFAIEKLGNFLIQEVNIRIGVKDGVRWLKDELGYLQPSLRYAEGKQEIDPRISPWINSIREVADEARITIERFSIMQEELAAKKVGVMDRLLRIICMCKKEVRLYKFGKEIESLKGRVVEIKKRRDEYKIDDILAHPNLHKRKRAFLRATSFENLVDVVGFEDDYRTLLNELVKEDPSLGMISIHGMGGLGKTTLASKLYHSSELRHFQTRAWVCVSEEYNIKDVLEKIIKSCIGQELDSLKRMDEVDLLHHLKDILQDRGCYLIVIDDIWDIQVWERIRKAFPDKQNGSRVIITTRNQEVARSVDDRCFVHQLRFLTENESWELFCKRAKPTKQQEKLGMEMVRKCKGLPLAIVVLSGLLLHKNWSDVNDHLWRKLKMTSREIHEILNLSYDDLSLRMKQCFLYLARYPEDQPFPVKDLMSLWIAEEFITEADEGDGVVMEDLAGDCLNELINRNMIQIAKLNLGGEVVYCRMHDLLRDLAIQKARGNKLLGIFDSSKQYESPINLLQGQPRQVIFNGISEYLNSVAHSSDDVRLRSLAVFNIGYSGLIVKLEETKLMFTRFIYLKVLDLRLAESDRIPEEIGNLVLLKFLGLVGGLHYPKKPVVIPPTIGKLKKLQVLCDSAGSYEVPREICETKELRHLHIHSPVGNLSITSHQIKLQTIHNIPCEDWMNIDPVNFSNLHTLGLVLSPERANAANSLDSMISLTSLQILTLHSSLTNVIPTFKPLRCCQRLKVFQVAGGKIKDPLELKHLPDSVTTLDLWRTNFTEDPMPALATLPNLTSLYLFEVESGNKMVCSQDGFPSLKYLLLLRLVNLEEWKVEDGALSSLKGLTITECEKLILVPERLKSIPLVPAIYMQYGSTI